MMREARHFNDYNFRAYAMRRVRGGFEKNRQLEGYVRVWFCLVDVVRKWFGVKGVVMGWYVTIYLRIPNVNCHRPSRKLWICCLKGRRRTQLQTPKTRQNKNQSKSVFSHFFIFVISPIAINFDNLGVTFPTRDQLGYSIGSFRDAAQAAFVEGKEQLAVLTRQSTISRLYPSAQSVMESPTVIE